MGTCRVLTRLFTAKTIFTALLFGALYALVIAVIAESAVRIWGRPTGVAYGILGYYYWIGLSVYGFVMVFVFRAIARRYALIVSLTLITVPTVLLLPDTGEKPFLSMYFGAIAMCLALAAWEYYRVKRHKQPS